MFGRWIQLAHSEVPAYKRDRGLEPPEKGASECSRIHIKRAKWQARFGDRESRRFEVGCGYSCPRSILKPIGRTG